MTHFLSHPSCHCFYFAFFSVAWIKRRKEIAQEKFLNYKIACSVSKVNMNFHAWQHCNQLPFRSILWACVPLLLFVEFSAVIEKCVCAEVMNILLCFRWLTNFASCSFILTWTMCCVCSNFNSSFLKLVFAIPIYVHCSVLSFLIYTFESFSPAALDIVHTQTCTYWSK